MARKEWPKTKKAAAEKEIKELHAKVHWSGAITAADKSGSKVIAK
jgi:hypothetical protein